jgi:hypothetical protein
VENVPESLAGISSKERAYPLVLSGSFVAKDPRSRSLEGFCGENPKRKTSNSIQLRLTIHPSHTGAKGDRTACRGRLNPDFREARNFTLLRAERVGKWGLSGPPLPVCPRQCPVSPIPPKPASRATKRSRRKPPPSVASGWLPVGSEGAPKCGGRGITGAKSAEFSSGPTAHGGRTRTAAGHRAGSAPGVYRGYLPPVPPAARSVGKTEKTSTFSSATRRQPASTWPAARRSRDRG